MLRRVLLALCALALASVQAHAQLLPGRAPGFRPGFQFLNSWAAPGAVYDADLANGLYTAGPPSISRASPGYAADSTGTYVLFGNDTLRRTNVGATVEVLDTNSIRNGAAQGAAVGSPGTVPLNWIIPVNPAPGVSRSIAGVGTYSGMDCLDTQFSGTTTDASWGSSTSLVEPESRTQIAAVSGQLWTLSTFLQVTAGSVPPGFVFALDPVERTSAGGLVRSNASTITVPTSGAVGATRQSVTTALSGGANTAIISPALRGGFTAPSAGTAVNFTLRQCWPHVSQTSRALSPIRTTSGAVTRQADVVTLPVAGVGRVVVTYDDGSTQAFTGISTATPWTIPAVNLNRSVIRRLTGYAS